MQLVRRWRLAGLFLVLLAACVQAAAGAIQGIHKTHNDSSAFIGWLGDAGSGGFGGASTAAAARLSSAAPPPQHLSEAGSSLLNDGVEVLSWEPRVFLKQGFLSAAECEHIRAGAQPRLAPSVTTHPETAQPMLDERRTSWGMFFNRREDAVIEAVEQRIAAWTMLPAENGEGLQVLQYERYDQHHDFFYAPSRELLGGNRVATVLLYLTDTTEGGETVFVDVPPLPHQTAANGWTQCGMQGLGVRPRRGDALLFWSLRPDGVFDALTRHASCPVVRGQKVVATRWIHEAHYPVSPELEGPKRAAADGRHAHAAAAAAGGAAAAPGSLGLGPAKPRVLSAAAAAVGHLAATRA